MTEKQKKQILSDIETYNILASAMAEKVNADRTDAILFALQKQNELLSELLDEEGG